MVVTCVHFLWLWPAMLCALVADLRSQQEHEHDDGGRKRRKIEASGEREQDDGEWGRGEGEQNFCLGQEYDAPEVREREGSKWPPDF